MTYGDLQPLFADDPMSAAAEGPDEDPANASALEWTVSALILSAAIAILTWTGRGAYLAIPFADAYDWIAQVFATQARGDWLSYLWLPHTEQRIPVARLVQAIDIEAIKGRAPGFLLATGAAWLTGGVALFALIWRRPGGTRLKVWLTGLAGVILTNVAAAEDLAFPVFSVYLFVAGPALAAFAALQMSPRDKPWSPGFIASLIFAGVASSGKRRRASCVACAPGGRGGSGAVVQPGASPVDRRRSLHRGRSNSAWACPRGLHRRTVQASPTS